MLRGSFGGWARVSGSPAVLFVSGSGQVRSTGGSAIAAEVRDLYCAEDEESEECLKNCGQ